MGLDPSPPPLTSTIAVKFSHSCVCIHPVTLLSAVVCFSWENYLFHSESTLYLPSFTVDYSSEFQGTRDLRSKSTHPGRTEQNSFTLPCLATHSFPLQFTATHCRPLQLTAGHCNSLQVTATHCRSLQLTAGHCNSLQVTATHCRSLQLTATQTCGTRGSSSTIPFLRTPHQPPPSLQLVLLFLLFLLVNNTCSCSSITSMLTRCRRT